MQVEIVIEKERIRRVKLNNMKRFKKKFEKRIRNASLYDLVEQFQKPLNEQIKIKHLKALQEHGFFTN